MVFFGASPDKRALADCPLDYDLRGDDMTAGVVQGLLVAQAFKDNPAMDKNGDGTIQYAFMKATQGTEFTRDRSDWAVATMSSYPELARPVSEVLVSYANFDPALGLKNLEAWLANPNFSKVEVILTNNDDTAIAIANELKKRGINIPVYGSDGGEVGLRAVNQACWQAQRAATTNNGRMMPCALPPIWAWANRRWKACLHRIVWKSAPFIHRLWGLARKTSMNS